MEKFTSYQRRHFRLPIFFVTVIVLITSSAISLGQTTPPTPQRGVWPGGAYGLSEIETIDTTSGNLSFNIPLVSLPPGRGGSSGASVNLLYNSKLWDTYGGTCFLWDEPHQSTDLRPSSEGGWRYGFQYQLQLFDYYSDTGVTGDDCGFPASNYIYLLKITFPDGSLHELYPLGYMASYRKPYSDMRPDGWRHSCLSGDNPYTSSTMTYYTVDGTYARVEIQHDSDNNWTNNPWTLFLSDGRRVTGGNTNQRIYDSNNNYIEIQNITYNSNPATKLVDQLNRALIIEYDSATGQDYVYRWGTNNQEIKWTVKWRAVTVAKTYWSADDVGCACTGGVWAALGGVETIKLPTQAGSDLQYAFTYNQVTENPDYDHPSHGWGEVSSITLPTGATAAYTYSTDGSIECAFSWRSVIDNSPVRKDLTFNQEYDGASTPVTETWLYTHTGSFTQITTPDNGVTTETFGYGEGLNADQGRVYKSELPDRRVERIWKANAPLGWQHLIRPGNSYLKTEFTTLKDAGGNLSKTKITDFIYDKNGNVTRVDEYDWINYSSIAHDGYGRVSGIPAGATRKKVTSNVYYSQTPTATDSSTNSTFSYWNTTAPNLRNAIASQEIQSGSFSPLTRVEYTYDSSTTTGNLIQQRSFDSTKGSYTNPLTTGNSIISSTQYNSYGGPTLITNPRGHQTQLTYGAVNGFTDLYPTQIKSAFQTGVQRIETREYDFYTGLVTLLTDVDNNVSTSSAYDALGRPTLVRSAKDKPEETRTATEYSDALRRIIVRRDLSAVGDGKLVNILHYDQMGRVRLTRELEDSTTQSATDETQGIKVQHRYRFSAPNSFELVSNSYRASTSSAASSEVGMGWTRNKSDNAGRPIEVQTFQGTSLPAPWGTSTASTGTVTMSYDANFTTMSDQMGRLRRNMVDGLGRTVRVDEPDAATNNLGGTSSPVQATDYSYDALGNLTVVTQGSQTRTFVYSSLARLTSAANPENGTVTYVYDNNGNLTQKTDARGVVSNHVYDALNRITTTDYSDTAINPDISRFYDGAVNGKGQFWYNYSGGDDTNGSNVEQTAIDSYDGLGRPLVKRQLSKLNGTWGPSYQTTVTYNRAGNVVSQVYPSGHTVTFTYDTAGRTSDFSGTVGDGSNRTYSTGILYSPNHTLVKEQLGTAIPIYNKLFYNSRGQLSEIRASTSYTSPSDTSWNRGAIINHFSDQCSGMCFGANMTDNDNNLKKQEVFIPNDDQVSGYVMRSQQYDYDKLNRLNWVREVKDGTEQWRQWFTYDRWGNRSINTTNTYGTGINNLSFEVETATNRLLAPGDSALTGGSLPQRKMRYDNAGNLTNDNWTSYGSSTPGQITRTYDAENRMTSAWDSSGGTSSYTYNADGQRTRRTVSSQQTWQIYGFQNELLAEYAANSSAATPQKEYGYRNGKLLITATPGSGNNSLSLNGTSNYGQISSSTSLNIAGSITLEAWVKVNALGNYQDIINRESWGQSGTGGGYELSVTNIGKARLDLYQTPTTYTTVIGSTTLTTGVWHHIAGVFDGSAMRIYVNGVLDGNVSSGSGPASGTSNVRIGRNSGSGTYYFNGLIDEARISNAAIYTSNFTPQPSLTAGGSTKGLWKFDGQSMSDLSGNGNGGTLISGAYSTDVPTGPAYYSGSFNGTSAYREAPSSTSLNIAGSITLEAWVKVNAFGNYQDIINRESWGQSGTGGGYELSITNIGKARLDLYQTPTTYTTVIGSTTLTTGVWHHIAGVFDGTAMRIYVNGVLDGNVSSGSGPASGTSNVRIGRNSGSGTYYFNGLIDEARISNAAIYTSNFTPQEHLTATGSTKALWKFDSQSPNDSSTNGNNATVQGGATYSSDVPGGGGGGGVGGGTPGTINWMVTDHLGTPRMIFDQSGSLANVKRHDYLPFGEELFAPVAGRNAAQGYSSGDGIRQQFTSKERDIETGLDYFEARYYASLQGRFTSTDPYGGSARAADPQTMNRYTLVLNNPLRYVDPNGLKEKTPWEQLTEEERKQLTPKLVRLKDPTKITQQELKAAGTRFNSLVTVKGDAQATADRIATAKSFVREFSSHGRAPHNDPAYRQIDQIQAIGRSTLEVTVKNKDAFLNALAAEGYSVNATEEKIAQDRSRRLRGRADHPFDNARSLTYQDTDPELHFANDRSDNPDYGPNYFFAHWDVSSVNCLAGCGPIGRALSGPKHAEGDAKPEQVTNYYKLRPQAPKP